MEVSAKAIEVVAEEIRNRGVSYDEIAEATLLSKSTISRLAKQHKASPFTIRTLVAYLEIGEKYREISGDDPDNPSGCQIASDLIEELSSVRSEWEQRFSESKASYEDRISFYREQLLSAQEERKRERETHENNYEKITTHLKQQIIRLQDNNALLVNRLIEAEKEAKEATQRAAEAEEARKQVEGNRHQVFVLFIAIIAIMLFVLVAMGFALNFALRTDRIL